MICFFNRQEHGDPLFKFIEHFSNAAKVDTAQDDGFNDLNDEEKVKKLLLDGDKERMLPLALKIKDKVPPELIVNEWLIDGMKVIGELFGNGQMQLPFVLQSAETMKATVDILNPFLPKQDKATETVIVLGTVKGDVHDVGKNLVDIILSNNGFKVINIGIKADINEFIIAVKEHKADAIGMSGLLVKSTAVMKENLEELKNQGIDVPVLLGGAALTKGFINDFCRPIYDGPIFYCRDAFDGVVSMQRIEKGESENCLLAADSLDEDGYESKEKEKFNPEIHTPIMPKSKKLHIPPFWGRKELHQNSLSNQLAFSWINHRILFRQRWGYKKGDMTPQAFQAHEKEVVEPLYEKLKEDFLNKKLFDPILLYGYYPCIAKDNKLYIFDKEYLYNNETEA